MMDHIWHMDFEGFSDPETPRDHLKDTRGAYRLNLFAEFNKLSHDKRPPIYTMREEATELPSAYLIYMYSDSEYEAAKKLVGSWQHWEKLLKCKPFVNGMDDRGQWAGLQAWRDEKEVQDRVRAYNQLKINAAQGHVQAQKMIFDGKTVTTNKRGRPSKEEVQRIAQEQAKLLGETKSDLKRIKLVVNGNTTRSN